MNSIHPTAVLGPQVQLGSDNTIGPYAVIVGPTRIGNGNWIGPHAVLGTPAEVRGIDHGAAPVDHGVGTGLTIGNSNVIREFTTIHQGHYATSAVGDDCYLMNKVYIGHDALIENGVTMASSVTLGGHVSVGTKANLGMNAVVHQRRVIGAVAMIGMAAVVSRDVPPAALAYGNPCRVHGANTVGLVRAGFSEELATRCDAAYRSGPATDSDLSTLLESPERAEIQDLWEWWDSRRA